jgi:hypothetical protein
LPAYRPIALALIAAASAPPPAPPVKTKVAVLALEAGPGVDPKIAELVSQTFVATLQQRRDFQVMSSKDVETALGFERQRQLLGCSQGSCLAELGGALGVDYLVKGSLGHLGGSLLFNADALNMRTNLVEQRFSQRLRGSSDEAFLDVLAPAVDALFPAPGIPVVRAPPQVLPAADAGAPKAPAGELTPSRPASLRPELKGQHPRLSFLAADLPRLKKRTAAPELAQEWASLRGAADDHLQHSPPLNDTAGLFHAHANLPVMAFAYLGSGDATYLQAARAQTVALASAEWPADLEVQTQASYSVAFAYDMLFPSLDPRERAAIRSGLEKHCAAVYEVTRPPKSWAAAAYSWRGAHGYAALAFCALAIFDESAAAQLWLDTARAGMQAVAGRLDPDGADHEGPTYASQALHWLGIYADALERDTGSDEGFRIPWLRQYPRYRAYTLMPDRKSLPPFGDAAPQESALISDVLTRLASHNSDGLAAWQAAIDRKELPKRWRIFDFVWEPTQPPRPPDGLPPSAVFPDLGVAVLRTGWGPDAAVLALKCGPPGGLRAQKEGAALDGFKADFGHDHPDASTFVYWQDHRWQIALPGGDTRDKRTRNENVWLASGKGQRGEGRYLDAAAYLGDRPQAKLHRAGTSRLADFAVCDAAPAYEETAGVRNFRRTLVLVHGASPFVVMLDRLSAQQPRVWSLYLHSQNGFDILEKTPSFRIKGGVGGYVLTQDPVRLDAHPLKVIDARMNEVSRGWELEVQTVKATISTWAVTVFDKANRPAQLVQGMPVPAVMIGNQRFSWDDHGVVSIDGQDLEPNLLK